MEKPQLGWLKSAPTSRWQYCNTHLLTNSTQNTQNGTYITIKRKNLGSVGRAPSFRAIPWHLPYN
jgi:hypothetical protein